MTDLGEPINIGEFPIWFFFGFSDFTESDFFQILPRKLLLHLKLVNCHINTTNDPVGLLQTVYHLSVIKNKNRRKKVKPDCTIYKTWIF